VANCPVRVFEFGDLDDATSVVSQKLRSSPPFRLLDGEGTEPRVFYLNGNPPSPDVREVMPVKGGRKS
jgi:Fe-S-cluster-containing dehydrogenase component